MNGRSCCALVLLAFLNGLAARGEEPAERRRSEPPVIHSSWDDLLEGVNGIEQWRERKQVLRQRYLDLIRDDRKPARPPLDLVVHERVNVEDVYTRQLISYQVEPDERAHAYLAIPLEPASPRPGIVALPGTYEDGIDLVAGLKGDPEVAHLDHLARRGYVVIAPEHFVDGRRKPAGRRAYDTTGFYERHPEWTAVGKAAYEHAIAIDVLQGLPEVDPDRIGVLGHSLGGHGAFFLAAYDARVKATACNCGATFFRHNRGVENWARDQWYVYFKHIRPALLEGKLPPIDMHEIIALIAPRAFLDLSGLNDGDPLTQRQRVLMNMKIMDVYELEGVPQNFAFCVHGRKHSAAHESRQLMYGWMDTHLKPPEETRARLVK